MTSNLDTSSHICSFLSLPDFAQICDATPDTRMVAYNLMRQLEPGATYLEHNQATEKFACQTLREIVTTLTHNPLSSVDISKTPLEASAIRSKLAECTTKVTAYLKRTNDIYSMTPEEFEALGHPALD